MGVPKDPFPKSEQNNVSCELQVRSDWRPDVDVIVVHRALVAGWFAVETFSLAVGRRLWLGGCAFVGLGSVGAVVQQVG